ncbi:MAG: hypothetical protein C4527_27045 [Candidatus Omnitrophota bacterium]|jgi:CRP-like cAMP-binding protein|nr:MAG: hypothetical protein C4527_27045 [Candidatus Omnitrophota bacterium]
MLESALQIASQDTIEVKKGTVLIREGEIGNCAYLVLWGRLQISRDINGKRVVIGEIRPVDIVGELAILDEMPRSATVTVVEDSRLIELNKHRMKAIIRRYPDIAEVVMKLLCGKLRATATKLVDSEIRYSEVIEYFSEKSVRPKADVKAEPKQQDTSERNGDMEMQTDDEKSETVSSPLKPQEKRKLNRMVNVERRAK